MLSAVRRRGAYANLLLPKTLARSGLSARDSALATELTYGTLRWQGFLDEVIDACSTRSRIDPEVRDVLRLGAYQVLETSIPAHAAVSTSVALAKRTVGPGAAGFVNAVLRRVNGRDHEQWATSLSQKLEDDPLGQLSIQTSHPRWMVAALADALDGDQARLRAVLSTNNRPARTTLVARPGLSTMQELVAAGGEPTGVSPWAARWGGGAPQAVAAVRDGRAGVQDEGSQLVVLALSRAEVVPGSPAAAGRLWLDMCAGPGGKAALLAAVAAQVAPASRLVAFEPQPGRARLVQRVLRGAGNAVGVQADGTNPPVPAETFSRVLVDAPCTGLGAIRRRPDSRWRRRPADLVDLVPLQQKLLLSACDLVAPGGVVGYATCSPHADETVRVVEHVLQRRPDLEVLDAPTYLPEVTGCARGKHVQLWPDRHGTDGMFLALFRRPFPPG